MNTGFQGIRVLVLEGYARQSLALVKAFHRLGCHVSAPCVSKLDVSCVSRYTDRSNLGVCNCEHVEETSGETRALLATREFGAAESPGDFTVAILSHNKSFAVRHNQFQRFSPQTAFQLLCTGGF